MTTFEDAARAEAERRYPHPVDVETGEPVDDWGYEAYARQAHIAGWEAARDHLAEQEASDEEVEAAARELAEWDGAPDWDEIPDAHAATWDWEIPQSAYIHGARRALRAAARARKGQER